MKKILNTAFSVTLVMLITVGNTYCYTYPTLFKTRSHAPRHLSEEDEITKSNIIVSPSSISIPENLGRVVEYHQGKGDSLVIHIQDRHADPTAQLNIAGILNELVTKYDTQLICLEGASSVLDTSFYDRFPDNGIKKKTAGFFLQKGFFTGAEYYRITNKDKYIRAQGVEDKKTYLEHLSAYNSNGIDKDKISGFLKAIGASLKTLEEKAYPKDLKDLHKAASSYYLKQIKLPEYLKTLKAYSRKVGQGISEHRNLDRFIELADKEDRIDFKKAEAEREAVIKKLSDMLQEDELEMLINNSPQFRLGKITEKEFYNYLYALIEKEGLDSSRYKNLTAYIDYIIFSTGINHLAVFDEAEDLEEELRLALCETAVQKDLVIYSKAANILKDLYRLKLTRRQLNYIDRKTRFFNISNIQYFLKTAYGKYGLSLNPVITSTHINQYEIDRSRKYYQVALKRDNALVNNTLKTMKRDRKDKGILITGGFHTEGLTNILREEDISYVVICPNIGAEDCQEIYAARMAGKLPGIRDLAEFFNHTLGAPLITADMSRADITEGVKVAFAALNGLSQEIAESETSQLWEKLTAAERKDILLETCESLAAKPEGVLYPQEVQQIVSQIIAARRTGGAKASSGGGGEPGVSFMDIIGSIIRKAARGETDSAILMADELGFSIQRELQQDEITPMEARAIILRLEEKIPGVVFNGSIALLQLKIVLTEGNIRVQFDGATREFKLLLAAWFSSVDSQFNLRAIMGSSGPVSNNYGLINLIFSRLGLNPSLQDLVLFINQWASTCPRTVLIDNINRATELAELEFGKDYTAVQQKILAILAPRKVIPSKTRDIAPPLLTSGVEPATGTEPISSKIKGLKNAMEAAAGAA